MFSCEARNFQHSTSELEMTDQVVMAPRDCSMGETPIFIHTAAVTSGKYFDRRTTIRQTWGQEAAQYKMRLFFVIGVPRDLTLQAPLQAELNQHEDILQFGFVEDYFNLTLKAIAELKWASHHCNSSSYMVKVDDDVVLNMPMLYEVVQKKMLPSGLTGLQHTAHAKRQLDNRHYMPPSVYVQDKFEFLMGFGYVLSMDRLKQMLNAVTNYPGFFIDIDDIFMTGLIADYGRIERNNSYRFRFLCNTDLCAMERSLMTHGCADPKNSETLYRLWKQNNNRMCQDMPLIREKPRLRTRSRRSITSQQLDLLVFY